MERLIILKPNQIFNLTKGGYISVLSGQVRLIRHFSNIVYTFDTIKATESTNVNQDITTDFIVNNNNTTSTFTLTGATAPVNPRADIRLRLAQLNEENKIPSNI